MSKYTGASAFTSLHFPNVSVLVVNYLWPLVFPVTALSLQQTNSIHIPSGSCQNCLITQEGYVQSFSTIEVLMNWTKTLISLFLLYTGYTEIASLPAVRSVWDLLTSVLLHPLSEKVWVLLSPYTILRTAWNFPPKYKNCSLPVGAFNNKSVSKSVARKMDHFALPIQCRKDPKYCGMLTWTTRYPSISRCRFFAAGSPFRWRE